MKTLIKNLVLNNWQRKGISVVIAIVIWMVVNHTLTTTKTLNNVSVRVINVPAGKTVENLQNSGLMSKRITLSLVGNKTVLDELSSNDLEVVVDATDKRDDWVAVITKKSLVSLNPEIDLSKAITRISHQSFPLHLTKLVTEKIRVVITQPIGDAPRGYQFLDVWPYHLSLTVSGPEDLVKRLKLKEQKLTFNLNDISKTDLDTLQAKANSQKGEEISYFIPDQWKQVSIPMISDNPIEIDDPQAKALRLDFVRYNLIPIDRPIPIVLFFPPEYSDAVNPQNTSVAVNNLVQQINGLNMITDRLYAKGVSRLFVQVVRDMMQIQVAVVPNTTRPSLEWSVHFINPGILEDRYVALLKSDVSDDEGHDLQPIMREDYWRNRFRSYMNRFRLFRPDDRKLELKIELKDREVVFNEVVNG